MKNADVIIVGAGLSGLNCARLLNKANVSSQILEASDGIGGRVRTDIVDGFKLDRGFQILLTAYPEAQSALDYKALNLRPFYAGSLIRFENHFHRVSDPFRHPIDGAAGAFSPIGTFADKLRVLSVRQEARIGTLDQLFEREETSTVDYLAAQGFSDSMIERFFRPFLSGVFLERGLETSSRMFQFVFRMFSEGDAAVPAEGMGEIPKQLAQSLPAESIRLNTRVKEVRAKGVTLEDGTTLPAKAVVVATEGPEAARMLSRPALVPARTVTCLYYAADRATFADRILVLNGDGAGPINNLCIPSTVSLAYAPKGKALISVSVVDPKFQNDPNLDPLVRAQLKDWSLGEVANWNLLKTYAIKHALPAMPVGVRKIETGLTPQGLYVCGDHCENASINGALKSGRLVAEEILKTQ